jgi:hypothetical protein
MYFKILKKTLFLLMMSLCLFFLTSCRTTGGGVSYEWDNGTGYGHPYEVKKAKGGPPPHAPAHGYRAKHHYRYYPSSSVYYDTHRNLYFYLRGDNWRMGVSLPQGLYVDQSAYVSIEMDSGRPYTHYKEHKHKYPPGKTKKLGKKKQKSHKG